MVGIVRVKLAVLIMVVGVCAYCSLKDARVVVVLVEGIRILVEEIRILVEEILGVGSNGSG